MPLKEKKSPISKLQTLNFFISLQSKHKKTQYNTTMNIKKNLGIILIVLGALLLILSYVCSLEDYNFYNFGALLIIIVGIVTHIYVTKRS